VSFQVSRCRKTVAPSSWAGLNNGPRPGRDPLSHRPQIATLTVMIMSSTGAIVLYAVAVVAVDGVY